MFGSEPKKGGWREAEVVIIESEMSLRREIPFEMEQGRMQRRW